MANEIVMLRHDKKRSEIYWNILETDKMIRTTRQLLNKCITTLSNIPIESIDSQRPHKPVMLEEILKYLVHDTNHFEVHLI